MHQILYPWGKNPWYPMDRRPGGSQSWSECGGEGKQIPSLPLLRTEPLLSSLQLCLYTD